MNTTIILFILTIVLLCYLKYKSSSKNNILQNHTKDKKNINNTIKGGIKPATVTNYILVFLGFILILILILSFVSWFSKKKPDVESDKGLYTKITPVIHDLIRIVGQSGQQWQTVTDTIKNATKKEDKISAFSEFLKSLNFTDIYQLKNVQKSLVPGGAPFTVFIFKDNPKDFLSTLIGKSNSNPAISTSISDISNSTSAIPTSNSAISTTVPSTNSF